MAASVTQAAVADLLRSSSQTGFMSAAVHLFAASLLSNTDKDFQASSSPMPVDATKIC